MSKVTFQTEIPLPKSFTVRIFLHGAGELDVIQVNASWAPEMVAAAASEFAKEHNLSEEDEIKIVEHLMYELDRFSEDQFILV